MITPHINDNRLTTFPITPSRQPIWDAYKVALRALWVPEDIVMNEDRKHYLAVLDNLEKKFVDNMLAFFSAFDGIINLNLAERFRDEINILEVKYFYDLQIMMENVHAETYAMMLNTLITDERRRLQLQDAINTMPIIKKMGNWARKWIDGSHSKESFAVRLVAMSAVEGVLFTGAFCAIYWLQNRGLMPGLGQANEYIARDERCHTVFATLLYQYVDDKLPAETIYAIFDEAVQLSCEFVSESLPVNLVEMNAKLMSQYIKYMADKILNYYNLQPAYGDCNPFPFMEQISFPTKTDFFVRRPSDYAKGEVVETEYSITEDF